MLLIGGGQKNISKTTGKNKICISTVTALPIKALKEVREILKEEVRR